MEIAKNTNLADVRVKVKCLVRQMKSFNFNFLLIVLKSIIIQIRIVSAGLQSLYLDLLRAVQLMNALKNSLTKLKSNDSYFTNLYNKVQKVCNEHKIKIPSVKKKNIK